MPFIASHPSSPVYPFRVAMFTFSRTHCSPSPTTLPPTPARQLPRTITTLDAKNAMNKPPRLPTPLPLYPHTTENPTPQGPAPQQQPGSAAAAASAPGAVGPPGSLGPVQGPARPASTPAVSADVLRMKPTHLRVHRPGGVNRVANRVGGGGAAGGAKGPGGLSGAGGGAAAGAVSVPRPAGAAFLTPRGARPRAGAGGGGGGAGR